jgi:hypothetical protein
VFVLETNLLICWCVGYVKSEGQPGGDHSADTDMPSDLQLESRGPTSRECDTFVTSCSHESVLCSQTRTCMGKKERAYIHFLCTTTIELPALFVVKWHTLDLLSKK